MVKEQEEKKWEQTQKRKERERSGSLTRTHIYSDKHTLNNGLHKWIHTDTHPHRPPKRNQNQGRKARRKLAHDPIPTRPLPWVLAAAASVITRGIPGTALPGPLCSVERLQPQVHKWQERVSPPIPVAPDNDNGMGGNRLRFGAMVHYRFTVLSCLITFISSRGREKEQEKEKLWSVYQTQDNEKKAREGEIGGGDGREEGRGAVSHLLLAFVV